MKINVRVLYLYLFSFVGLLIVVVGSIRIVNLGLKALVFKEADKYEYFQPAKDPNQEVMTEEEQTAWQERDQNRQRQRELSDSLAMIGVGIPLYLYHWKTIQKEKA